MESDLLALIQRLYLKPDSKIAILGIGNELNGDDAAGVLAARALIEQTEERESRTGSRSSRLLIYEAGPAPENFTGPLRRFAPDAVFLIDAAEMDVPPGTVRLFDWSETSGMSASTHTLPPSVLGRFLTEELGCRVVLIGIQPGQLDFGKAVSPAVQAGVDEVVAVISRGLIQV